MKERRKTRAVKVGNTGIGGSYPVSIQSMTNLPLADVQGTIDQINRLEKSGADIVRLAIRDEDSVKYLKRIIDSVSVPLVGDIHFNHRIAIKSIEAGISKIRLNPGNIGAAGRVRDVVKAALDHDVPIRIGVNGGSINRKKFSLVNPENLVASAAYHIKILEDCNFNNIVVSIKSSDLHQTIEANMIFSEKFDYPLHIGLTEAGYGTACIVQSSIAMGHLLMLGIGDTIRVSMTGDPVKEIDVAKKILESTGHRKAFIKIISCPTCGRTDTSIDILAVSEKVEVECSRTFADKLIESNRSLTIAIMGCEVNGPGEASHADFGLAGLKGGDMILFAKGEKLRRVNRDDAVDLLLEEIEKTI